MHNAEAVVDQLGVTIPIPATVRIVCLVPFITELLYHLQLHDNVVGITKYCTQPAHWASTKCIIGGTKNVAIDAIQLLKPTLIIASKEENMPDQVMALKKCSAVYTSNVVDLISALQMIQHIGQLTHSTALAKVMCATIKSRFNALQISGLPIPILYLIWRKPYMSIGGDTYISNMLTLAHCTNVLAHYTRYPQVDVTTISMAYTIQAILLSSEPFPFKQKHIEELQILLPNTPILLVDGAMCSWYGSKLLEVPAYFESLYKTISNAVVKC